MKKHNVEEPDIVEESSEESFPASDPPSFTPTTGSVPKPLKTPKPSDRPRTDDAPAGRGDTEPTTRERHPPTRPEE